MDTADLFDELRQELVAYFDKEQIDAIHRAYCFADRIHLGQQRQSGEPYISHPLAVARILITMRLDHQSIMAAILHDVLEESTVPKSDIIKEFGQGVADLVDGVSKLTQIKFENRAQAQAENFRKMLLAMTRDIRVILVKLADRLHNMRTISVLPAERQRRIALETLEIYAPIAHRLGMHNFRVEFEELGFAAIYPMRYRALKKEVEKARGHRKEILNLIKNALKKRLEEHGIPASSVVGRQKHLYSIYRKMRSKSRSFAEIMDIYAFRIIVEDVDTCYRALGVAHGLYKPLPERFKDYIAIPKANGYQSLHTTLFGPYGVPVEIQIRTTEMDYMADNGIAAHWLYKDENKKASDAETQARKWLRGLLELQKGAKNPLEFIENVKIDLFPNEVYIFTPEGEIMELPRGATAVDFAYAIHSDVGNSCVAAKIDRRLAPLSSHLVNGQTVEVITAPGACPNSTWLNFVVTSKARSSIRHFVKNQHREESISLGKQLIANALTLLNSSWEKLMRKNVNNVLNTLNYKTIDDLCEAVGLGQQLPLLIAQRLVGETKAKNKKKTEDLHQGTVPLFIKGTEGMAVSFAECCRPIPGDSIVGYVESGRGIVIHMELCEQAINLKRYSEKCVPVRWEESVTGDFKVDIFVEIPNERGALATITNAISREDANIDNIGVAGQRGNSMMVNLTLSIQNRIHLANVFRRLRGLKVVSRVSRNRLA